RRRRDGFALLGPKRRQHGVGGVHPARRTSDPDSQAMEGAAADALDDVAQAVVAAVSATLALADLAQREVQVVVDDKQARRGWTPALDGLQDELTTVVHVSTRQGKARA